jgi:hypothetical protein
MLDDVNSMLDEVMKTNGALSWRLRDLAASTSSPLADFKPVVRF